MDSCAGPRATQIVENSLPVQSLGDFPFGFAALRKASKNLLDCLNLAGRAGGEDDAICL